MTPQLYYPDGRDHDGIYDEAMQTTNPFYAPGTLATSVYSSHLQPGPWQQQPTAGMDQAPFQTWDTHRIVHNNEPVMFDWQASPVGPWDMQAQNFSAVSHNGHVEAFQASSIASNFQGPPLKFEKIYEPSGMWETTRWIPGPSPIVEVGGDGQDRMEISLPVSMSPDRASKRRRASSMSTMGTQSSAPMRSSTQLSPDIYTEAVDISDQPNHLPTPPFSLPSHMSPINESQTYVSSGQSGGPDEELSPLYSAPDEVMQSVEMPSTTTAPIFQMSPVLIPSVRVISDRRESLSKLRRGSNAVFKTQSANAKRGHYASDVWEGHKAAIKKMYIDEGKPLREVIKAMETDHNFPATQRMYKARFKQWGFVKNNTEKVVSQILRTKFERDAEGKLSQFTRNGKDVNLHNYLQRKGLTEYDLVDFQPSITASTNTTSPRLAHVRCRTPPFDIPAALRLPDRLRFQDTLVMSFKRAFLVWRHEEQASVFGLQPSVFTWRVTDFPHLSSLIESARLIRAGDGVRGVAALNKAFWAMDAYLASMDATASFYFFFHRQSRPWQEDARIALAVWKFLAAYAASAARGVAGHGSSNGGNHPLFHTFRLMYEVIQKEGVVGLRELLTECANTVADELERAFGREHYLKDLIWARCFPEKSKLRQMQLVRDLRDHGPTKKIVKRLY